MAVTLPIRIGTRGSPLALAQAREVQARLTTAHNLAPDATAITILKTTGDAVQDRPLSEIGGKGLFTKELESALQTGSIDIAVHSMKDVPTRLQDGHALGAILPREDVRDVLVSPTISRIEDLPQGAVFGTSSLRRRAQLLAKRPDLQMVEFRGNVQTRLQKLEDGIAVATILAKAGLNRLGQADFGQTIPTQTMLPAIAQGAVGIEYRAGRDDLAEALAVLDDPTTRTRVTCERAFLAKLDGSCRTPIAGLALLEGDALQFTGQVLSPDGAQSLMAKRSETGEPALIGVDAAEELLAQGAAGLF